MSTVTERLAELGEHLDPDAADGAATVPEVLQRGRVALRRRRAAQGVVSIVGVTCLASLAFLAFRGTGPDRAAHDNAVSGPTHSTASTATHRPGVGPAAITLVAYRGAQLPGYTITHVPSGYVLQGVSNSVLDIAPKGDHSPLDTFTGKLVVMLNDHPGQDSGARVTVRGHDARINRDDDAAQLTWNDGKHFVDVQCWHNVHLTDAQLVDFADGVTVTSAAVTGHG